MTNTVFLQSEVSDPYAVYEQMVARHPIVYDESNRLWAVYGYGACQEVLTVSSAHIPAQNQANIERMNPYARAILENLVRLKNPPEHARLRPLVSDLFGRMKRVPIGELLEPLLLTSTTTLEWVDAVCKKLPALSVLRGFGFSEDDTAVLLESVAALCTFMQPEKSAEVVAELNTVAAEVYPRVERHLTKTGVLAEVVGKATPATRRALVANFIGFVIQSYDAGRGLLSNTLLQVLNHGAEHRVDEAYFRRAVVESLRFDPAIHNTRRVMREDTTVAGQALQAGEAVLVVLAAANRDPQVFEHPRQFDLDRDNNGEHLTFGAGIHSCMAKHHMVELTVGAMAHLFARFPNVALLDKTLTYEPVVNARLPKKMRLGFPA